MAALAINMTVELRQSAAARLFVKDCAEYGLNVEEAAQTLRRTGHLIVVSSNKWFAADGDLAWEMFDGIATRTECFEYSDGEGCFAKLVVEYDRNGAKLRSWSE